jgi:hypothetical protein
MAWLWWGRANVASCKAAEAFALEEITAPRIEAWRPSLRASRQLTN